MYNKKKSQGNKVENELIEHLNKIGFDRVEKNKVYDERYSFDVTACCGNDWISFECKNDLMSYLTGNLAFEYWNSKKNEPSGYARSKAVFWVHKFNNKLYYCLLKELKKFIEENEPKKKIIAGGDDNSNMYIYGKDSVKDLFKELSNSTLEDLMYEYTKSIT